MCTDSLIVNEKVNVGVEISECLLVQFGHGFRERQTVDTGIEDVGTAQFYGTEAEEEMLDDKCAEWMLLIA